MSNPIKFTQHFLILLLFGLLAGCAYHEAQTCNDSAKYTYTSVDSIFNNQSCTACHGSGGSSPLLSDSTTIRAYVKDKKDRFIQSIRFKGDHPMPKGGPAMSEADMKKIETWICQGMK